jgi:hypothetical protein
MAALMISLAVPLKQENYYVSNRPELDLPQRTAVAAILNTIMKMTAYLKCSGKPV